MGPTRLVETRENTNKLVECILEVFIDSNGIKGSELKKKIVFKVSAASSASLVLGKTANCYVIGEASRKVKEAFNSVL